MDGPLQLFWKDQRVGRITDYGWSDFPWLVGKIALARVRPELRKVLRYVATKSATEEGLTDWPFDDELSVGWAAVDSSGARKEVSLPVIDLSAGTVTWR